MAGRRPRVGEWTLEALLGLVVLGSVLAIGSVHVPVLLAVAIAVTATTALAVALRDRGAARLPAAVWIFVALAALCALQAVPLPLRWLQAIAPANADVWARALLPFGEGAPARASLSLDPGASMVEAVKWLVYAGVFASAAVLSSRVGAEIGVGIVFGSAVVTGLATLGHGLVGATRVFGIYQPRFPPPPWHVGPLLNANNLGGYLNLGALCGAGLLLMRRPLFPRWVSGLGVATVVALAMITASRAGVIALLIGFAALGLMQRTGDAERPRVAGSAGKWFLLAALSGGCFLALLAADRETWTELFDKDLRKLEVVTWVVPMLRDHPLLGVGRGAFESVMPAYRFTGGDVVYTHIESFPAQWASEWGLPVAVAALCGLALAFRPSRLGVGRSAVAAAAWVGFAVLLLQNLLDLALEVPAVCIAAAVVMGSLAGDRRRLAETMPSRRRTAFRVSPAAQAALVIVVGSLSIAGAAACGWRDLGTDQTALRDAYAHGAPADPRFRETFRAELHDAMERHPAEPYFPLMGALLAYEAQDQDPMPWLTRSLERAPMNGKAHLLVAEVLAARHAKRQALFELRMVAGTTPDLVPRVAALVAEWASSYDEILLAVPDGAAGGVMLELIGGELASHPERAELRARCDVEAIARDGTRVGARVRHADDLIAARSSAAPSSPCPTPEACDREIEEQARAIDLLVPERSTAAKLRARRLVSLGRAREASMLLAAACAEVTDRVDCDEAWALAASTAGAKDLLAVALRDLLSAACAEAVPCARAATWAGDLLTTRQEWSAALAQYGRAAREDPGEFTWLKLAAAASRAGDHGMAIDALEKVERRGAHVDPALRRRIDDEKQLLIVRLGDAPAGVDAPPAPDGGR
jgi:hypothetical protein